MLEFQHYTFINHLCDGEYAGFWVQYKPSELIKTSALRASELIQTSALRASELIQTSAYGASELIQTSKPIRAPKVDKSPNSRQIKTSHLQPSPFPGNSTKGSM